MLPREASVDDIIQDLDFCGCGSREQAYTTLRDTLAIFDKPDAFNDHEGYNKAYDVQRDFIDANDQNHLLVYFLDSHGLLEHGSSIYWSWLDPNGKKLLTFLRENGCNADKWSEEALKS